MKLHTKTDPESPRIPETLKTAEVRVINDHAELTEVTLMDCDLSGQSALGVVFEQAVIRHASFGRSRFSGARLMDIRCEASDFAGAEWQRTRWQRVTFKGCKLTGMQLSGFQGMDIVFRDCAMESAIFANGRLTSVRFENCRMRRTMFDTMGFKGVTFFKCDLTGADVSGSRLERVDFRGSELSDFRIESRQLQGTMMDPLQAVQMAILLGIIVKDPGD